MKATWRGNESRLLRRENNEREGGLQVAFNIPLPYLRSHKMRRERWLSAGLPDRSGGGGMRLYMHQNWQMQTACVYLKLLSHASPKNTNKDHSKMNWNKMKWASENQFVFENKREQEKLSLQFEIWQKIRNWKGNI